MDSLSEITIVKKLSLYNRYKLTIPKEVEDKIRFICQKVWDIEWSGILFYTYEGSFETDDLNIICKDIYVMDIGNATYTEFDMSPDVIAYMTENRELLDCQQALIHSHNQMSTFFSGTDINTLKEEGAKRNNFVSLIVNNAGSYTAAITRRIKKIVTESSSYEFFDKGIIDIDKPVNKEVEEIEYIELNVVKEDCSPYFENIDNRLEEIKETKKSNIEHKENNTILATPIYTSWQDYYNTSKNNKKEELPLFEDACTTKYDILPYDTEDIDKQNLRTTVLQLITGSVVISKDSKLDPNKWANSMVLVFNKRFDKNLTKFQYWADGYVDFIITNIEDKKLVSLGFEMTEIQSIYSYRIVEELKKLPTNIYIQALIKTINSYI